MRGNQTKVKYQVVRVGIDRMATNRYRDYKYNCHTHYKLNRPNVPFTNVSDDEWRKCADLFTSPEYVVSIQLNYYSSYIVFLF